MKQLIISVFFLTFSTSEICGQESSFNDLKTILTISTDAGAEKLLSKCFEVIGASSDGSGQVIKMNSCTRNLNLRRNFFS